MAIIPEAFSKMMAPFMAKPVLEALVYTLEQTSPQVSFRLNKAKFKPTIFPSFEPTTPINWAEYAFWINQIANGSSNPRFAFDPLWHAGYYYVQEAASMALSLIKSYLPSKPLRVLDLCAAPGGKTTLLFDILPNGSWLVANEPIAKRNLILAENLARWGRPELIVTQAYPEDLAKSGLEFDLILVDAPCSGEGMFRKSDEARRDWSPQLVEMCAIRQRQILSDAWKMLAPEGFLAYSTCTFNRHENEHNARFITETLGATHLPLSYNSKWGFVEGDNGLGFHCYPSQTPGEGFYLAFFQKKASSNSLQVTLKATKKSSSKAPSESFNYWVKASSELLFEKCGSDYIAFYETLLAPYQQLQHAKIPIKHIGTPVATPKGKVFRPHELLPFSTVYNTALLPQTELLEEACIPYFRGESIPFASSDGFVCLTYKGIPIGLGNATRGRLNNLFPKAFRLRFV